MSFGRLERTKGSPPISDINMTPLIDVMLVLLVIFIITAPLMTSAIKLDLPKTEAAKPVDAPKSVSIIVDKTGQIFLNDQVISLTQLAESLSKTAQMSKDTEVQLRADEAVPYGKVVELMDVAQKVGLNRIGFIAEAKADAKSTK
jgi:biopolymer transport protein TolR